MPQSYISSLWGSAVPCLHLRSGNDDLTTASGFFWKDADRVFLVSNSHCFAGVDPDNGRAMRILRLVLWITRSAVDRMNCALPRGSGSSSSPLSAVSPSNERPQL
jgi:hypothetical protein